MSDRVAAFGRVPRREELNARSTARAPVPPAIRPTPLVVRRDHLALAHHQQVRIVLVKPPPTEGALHRRLSRPAVAFGRGHDGETYFASSAGLNVNAAEFMQ